MGNQLCSSNDEFLHPQSFYNFVDFVHSLKQGVITPRFKKGAKSTISLTERAKFAQLVKDARDRYYSGVLDIYEKSENFYEALVQVFLWSLIFPF